MHARSSSYSFFFTLQRGIPSAAPPRNFLLSGVWDFCVSVFSFVQFHTLYRGTRTHTQSLVERCKAGRKDTEEGRYGTSWPIFVHRLLSKPRKRGFATFCFHARTATDDWKKGRGDHTPPRSSLPLAPFTARDSFTGVLSPRVVAARQEF